MISRQILTTLLNDKADEIIEQLTVAEEAEFKAVNESKSVKKLKEAITETQKRIIDLQGSVLEENKLLKTQVEALKIIFKRKQIQMCLDGTLEISKYGFIEENYKMSPIDVKQKKPGHHPARNSSMLPEINGSTMIAQRVIADFRKEVLKLNIAIETLGKKDLKDILDEFMNKRFV